MSVIGFKKTYNLLIDQIYELISIYSKQHLKRQSNNRRKKLSVYILAKNP